MAEQAHRIAVIEQKIRSFEMQIASLETYVDANPDYLHAELRLSGLSELYHDYLNLNDELTFLNPDHPRIADFDKIQTAYYNVATTVTRFKRASIEPLANSTRNTNNISVMERHDLPKLPTIKIPVFNGNHDEWLSFKNKFIALVHSREDISGLIKYTQLENALTGSALGKLVEFHASDANYPKAWQALCDAYDQKRLIVTEHLDALLDLPSIAKANPNDLASLIDQARQHLNMLEQVEVKVNDDIVIRILERCLPSTVLTRWQDRLDSDELPKLDEFYKFIQSTIFKLRSLEKASAANRNCPRKRPGDKCDKNSQTKSSKYDARSLVTTSSNSSENYPSLGVSCRKCGQQHALFKCAEFNNLKIQERWDLIKSQKLCRNCLSAHPQPCKSSNRCQKCNREHHTLLHSEKKTKNDSSSMDKGNSADPKSSSSTSA